MIPFNPFSALTSKIYGVLAIGAFAFAGLQTLRIEGFLFVHGFKQDLAEARDTISDFKRASEEAERRVAERDQRLAVVNRELSDATNAISDAAFNRARPAVIAYRDAHRVSPACVGPSGGTIAAPVSGDPEGPPQPPTVPDMVAIPGPDYDLLTTAALQSGVQYEYLQALIRSGQAIPEPDMGAK